MPGHVASISLQRAVTQFGRYSYRSMSLLHLCGPILSIDPPLKLKRNSGQLARVSCKTGLVSWSLKKNSGDRFLQRVDVQGAEVLMHALCVMAHQLRLVSNALYQRRVGAEK